MGIVVGNARISFSLFPPPAPHPMDPHHDNELFIGADRLERLCAPAGDRSPPPRTLLVLAHPGDETTGASSRLTRADLTACVYATDGEGRGHSIEATHHAGAASEAIRSRRAETLRALAHAGISSERAVFLGHPGRMLAHRLPALAADLRRWFIATQPEVVLTHAYEGLHPDYDAVAFAVHAAVAAQAQEGESAPTIIEFASCHASDDNGAGDSFQTAETSPERTVRLTADGRALKRRLLACFRSFDHERQKPHLDEERFRLAPAYDFCRPPHAGTPYERRGLFTAEAWCEAAGLATERFAKTNQTCVLK